MHSMQTSKNYTAGFYFKRELDRDTKAILVQNISFQQNLLIYIWWFCFPVTF